MDIMNESSSKTLSSQKIRKTSTLEIVSAIRAPKPKLVVPGQNTASLICRYISQEIDFSDDLNRDVWERGDEVSFNLKAHNGIASGPRTSVRFLWTDSFLHFYVEVEQDKPCGKDINNSKVWMGNNIEFLLTPRWFAEPFYDEYEFLFNSFIMDPPLSNHLLKV